MFSDKTGTLTQNKMVFTQCSIMGDLFECSPEPQHDSSQRVGQSISVRVSRGARTHRRAPHVSML